MKESASIRRAAWAPWIVAVAFLLSPALALRLRPQSWPRNPAREFAALQARNTSALGRALGEIRATATDMLFLKTERYLHGGVAYVTACEHLTEERNAPAPDESEDHAPEGDETGVPEEDQEPGAAPDTVILTPERDFRGWVGELHRRVKPWQDPEKPHVHTNPSELLPWYRLMTLSDPHNVRAYAIGAWWLKSLDLDQAIEFTREGLQNNPEAFQIHLILGQCLYQKARLAAGDRPTSESQAAQPWIEQARAAYIRAADLAADRRPASYDPATAAPIEGWDESMDEDALAAARLAVMLAERHGAPADALALARRYQDRLGPDATLGRYIRRLTPPDALKR